MTDYHVKPLASREVFLRRVANHGGIALLLIGVSLLAGILGYHWVAGFSWVDSLLNASMILGGMGPVKELPSTASKIGASLYALYSGLVLLVSVGVLGAPLFHRVIHKWHLEGASKN